MHVILFRPKADDGAPWQLLPNALYYTRARALQDVMSLSIHNEDKVYQAFKLSPVKG